MNRLFEIINEMLEEAGEEKIEELKESMRLREDLNMDSFMLAELTVKVEAEFGIDIFEKGIVRTIGEILVQLEGK